MDRDVVLSQVLSDLPEDASLPLDGELLLYRISILIKLTLNVELRLHALEGRIKFFILELLGDSSESENCAHQGLLVLVEVDTIFLEVRKE